MLVVSVELLHGTFRGDPDGTANTGGLSRGEWPPSPSRLFAALVAADGTGRRCRVTDGSELRWFVRLPPPVIHADAAPCHQPLEPRYVVVPPKSPRKSAHLEYVGRTGVRIRPGYRVTPRHPHIVYRWDAEVPAGVLDALRRRAARIGYLGAADTPVRVRVGESMPDREPAGGVYRPDPAGDVAVSVPEEGDLELLDRMFDAWSRHGPGVGRSQFPALRHRVGYRSPAGRAAVDRGGVVAWLRLGRAVAGRRVSSVTAVFKDAVLSRFQAIHGEPPPVLHGHGFRRKGFDLARYLALPDVGHRRSRGYIHGLALWLPPGSDSPERARIREAAFSVSRLHGHGVDVSVRPTMDETGIAAAATRRWTRTARCWTSAFPVVHERRVPVDLNEVTRWCRHAGLSGPSAFRSARAPFIPGGVDMAPAEVNRPGRGGRPYSHVMIWFDEPVTGPVVLGSARQRGLGLCVDVPGDSEVDAV